jgi:transcription initiation factor TFIIB
MAHRNDVATTANRRREHPQEREQADETETDCPECGASLVHDEERAETVCSECGIVIEEDMVDRGPEWRAFDAQEKDEKSRVGAPTTKTMHDKGLSTTIGWQDKDAYGRALSSRKRERMKRLRTWDERFRTKTARERNLKQALGEIDRMASALGLPENVRETASVIYRRALEEDLLPGRSIEAMATASLYAAARQANTPRSLDECARVSRVDQQSFARAYRYVVSELGLAVEPADPASYLPRFVSDLDLSEEVERLARELLEAAKEESVHSGKSPVGLAAASIYAAALLTNERVTQSAVGEVTEVSEVTIRNRYKELLDAAEDAPAAG